MHLKSQAHESYWNRTGTDCLDFFLLAAAYEQILKQKYSTFFQQTIIPALPHYSPYPSSWKPHLTYNSVPFEPARNIQGCYQQIRFAFEPVGPSAGKKADPFNQILPTSFVDSIAASGLYPALDLTSWHHFKNEFFIAESDIKILQAQMLGEGVDVDVPPTCFFAFDLPRNTFALTLQPYLFPHRRAFFERKTITEVVFDAVRKLDSLELSLLPALSQVEDLVTSRGNTVVSDMGSFTPNLTGAEKEISVEMLSIDCIDPATARIKMYGKTNDTSFANVRDIYTFALKEFWKRLLGLPDDWNESEQQEIPFLFFAFEIMPGKDEVDVKVCVPAWTLGADDVSRRLAGFFRKQGWSVGQEDEKNLQGAMHESGMEKQKTGYTYISFAHSKKEGVYMTLYYTPILA